jgi:hypothetical protein
MPFFNSKTCDIDFAGFSEELPLQADLRTPKRIRGRRGALILFKQTETLKTLLYLKLTQSSYSSPKISLNERSD